MENKGDETRVLTSSKTLFYSLFIFFVVFVYSLSIPFRFHSFGIKLTNFLDINDRHCIFLLCNCILFLLFLDACTNQVEPEAKKVESDKMSVANAHDHGTSFNLLFHVNNEHELANEEKPSRILVHVDDHNHSLNIHVQNEHESAAKVNQSAILVRVDVDDDDDNRIEGTETELDSFVEDGRKMVADIVVVEEEHHDQEEAEEFRKKCEAFIKKARKSMHHEGPSYPMIDYQESVG